MIAVTVFKKKINIVIFDTPYSSQQFAKKP